MYYYIPCGSQESALMCLSLLIIIFSNGDDKDFKYATSFMLHGNK